MLEEIWKRKRLALLYGYVRLPYFECCHQRSDLLRTRRLVSIGNLQTLRQKLIQ